MTNNHLDLSALRGAVSSLQDGLEVVSDGTWFDQQSGKVQNTLIAGVIQNFEFVYEISFKMIKRQIEEESASPNEVDESNFREVLRVAAEKGQQVYQDTLIFINDARALLKVLEARNA